MFERFSEGARRVVVMATEESRKLEHGSIGSEHLLLAVVRDPAAIAAQVLGAHGVTYDAARREVERAVGTGGGSAGHLPFTPNAKKTLELSLREALELRHPVVAPEHVALALARERYTVAARVFDALEVDTGGVREALLARRDEFGDVPEGAAGVSFGMSQSALLTSGRAAPMRARTPGAPGFFGGPPERRCSVCGRSEVRVSRMVVARGIAVCDRCVDDLVETLASSSDDTRRLVRLVPREVQPPDGRRATAAITEAFSVVFGVLRGGIDDQVAVIEDGPELRPLIEAWVREGAARSHVALDVTVERVRFVDEHEAEVSLGIWLQGNTASPMIQPARAVEVDGAWKVSRDTVARFAQLAGVRFPPRQAD